MPSGDQLRDYRRKRKPGQTAEPAGKAAKGRPGRRKGPIFVIQRHQARALHYDLRLERDGALASWAVPKGMPLEPGQQHLAVHVEDHPLEYAAFEGEIPKGKYGAGTVEIWDRGTYELLEEKKDGGLTFRLDGERLQGTWALIPAHLSGQEKNWLVLRKREETAEPKPLRGDGRYRPMLATPVKELPRGDGWLFEPKWDGYRALAYVRGGEVELQSRTGKSDLTNVSTRSRGRCHARFGRPTACSTARSAPWTTRAARASRRSSRGRGRSSTTSSTCSSRTASRSSTCR